MATCDLRSTTGNDVNSGANWANARATCNSAMSVAGAGGTVYMSQVHAESSASNITMFTSGTVAAPLRIVCGNDAADPPTAVATTGSITTTATAVISMSAHTDVYGVKFNIGSGASNASMLATGGTGSTNRYEKCQFSLVGTGGSSFVQFGTTNNFRHSCDLVNCDFKFSNIAQKITLFGIRWRWRGGSFLAGSTTPTTMFSGFPNGGTGNDMEALIEDVDFSQLGNFNFFTGTNSLEPAQKFVVRNCKLPAAWSGLLILNALSFPSARVSMYNCDAGALNYKVWIEDWAGTIKDDITNARTGGATDGVTPIAWKMVSNANAVVGFPRYALESDTRYRYNKTVGSAITVTMEILRDSVTNLNDNEIWIDVSYLGSSAQPLGTLITDATADPLTTAAAQTASAVTWNTSGMANPNKQKLSVTFTPQMKGMIAAKVVLAKPSTTVFVDPVIVIS